MIKTATQLKAKIRNVSGGDSKKAQVYIRNYVMERFFNQSIANQNESIVEKTRKIQEDHVQVLKKGKSIKKEAAKIRFLSALWWSLQDLNLRLLPRGFNR